MQRSRKALEFCFLQLKENERFIRYNYVLDILRKKDQSKYPWKRRRIR
jgi:hypothetical protein